MKKLFVLAAIAAASLFFSPGAVAQEKAKTEITSVKKSGETIRLTLASSKPFIFGNNRYVLYIGSKEFFEHEQQTKKNGKGYITFLIPSADFDHLAEGAGMYLSYGKLNVEEMDQATLAKRRMCWMLGKFSKNLLK